MRRVLLIISASCLALVATAFVTAPGKLNNTAPAVLLPDEDLEQWLMQREAAVDRRTPIVPDTEKHIRWADPGDRGITAIAVVYIHGFSATRQAGIGRHKDLDSAQR